MKLKGKTIECEIEKLVFGGYGLGRYQEKIIFVYNALPGERVQAWVSRDKKHHAEAIATTILTPSPHRQAPLEAHFLSCSPWQIMDYAQENFWKKTITQEVFLSLANLDFPDLPLVNDPARMHYRNKMEFSFWEEEGELFLAFFKRGQKHKQPIPHCTLAQEHINAVALRIVAALNRHAVSRLALKTLILRSNLLGEVIAALFVKDEAFPALEEITVSEELKGFSIHYSNPKSPASVSTKILHQRGTASLRENLLNQSLEYGLLSFFQIHVPLFEKVLVRLQAFVEGTEIVDYYCGVGAIGIALAKEVKRAVLVDINEDSIHYAQKNIKTNDLAHFSAHCHKAESLLEHIAPHKVIILDPPRSGLHRKFLKHLCEKRPKRIVYLSCNLATCARDLKELKHKYNIIFKESYNFFPATPHIEFLAVLDRKAEAVQPPNF